MTARDRTVLMVVVVLVALAAGWLLVVSPKRGAAAKLGSDVQAAQQQLATLQAQVASEQRDRASFSSHYVELAQLGEAVPQDDNVPSLLVELQSAARASNVDFRGLQVTGGGSSGPIGAAAGAASARGGASAAQGGSAAGSAAAAATPPPPGVTNSSGFGAEQFTFTFTGQFFDLSDFLGRIENLVVANGSLVRVSGRLMTLNAISLGPAQGGFPAMTASVSATTYLLPASQGLFDGATAAGPATAPTGSASAGAAIAPAGTAPTSPTGVGGSSTSPTGVGGSSTSPTGVGGTSTNPPGVGGSSTSPSGAGRSSTPSGSGGSYTNPSGAGGSAAGGSPATPTASISPPSGVAGGSR